MICHEKKFIFLHVPRTGGTSIQCMLNEAYAKCPGKKYKDFHSPHINDLETYKEYFSFAFVRNPWERILSFYLFDKYGSNKHSFFNWLKVMKYRNKFVNQMSNWILDSKNELRVKFVGRYEQYSSDIKKVCENLNISFKEPPLLNKTDHSYYTDYYDNKTKDMVYHLYKRDVVNFKYEYGQ